MTNTINKVYYVEKRIINNQDGSLIIVEPIGAFNNIKSSVQLCQAIIADIKDIGDSVEENGVAEFDKNRYVCYSIVMSNKENKLNLKYSVIAMDILN